MRRTSMGAAAVGALAVTGGSLVAPNKADAAVPRSKEPVVDGTGVMAHVTNARTGEISILVGEREIKYINRDMAQQLMRVAK